MPRYRLPDNGASISIDGVFTPAAIDGTFTVAASSRAEAVLLAAGAQQQDYPVSSEKAAATQALVSGARISVATPLVTVFAGNSIAEYDKWGGTGATGGYTSTSEFGYAQQFSGLRVIQRPIATAGTYGDACGNYYHPAYQLVGATSSLMSELESVHFAALDAASLVPQLWLDIALFENDCGLASADTSATVLATLDKRVASIRAKFPGILYMCCTPRPDYRITTAARIAMWQSIRDGVLARDNSLNWFACNLSDNTYNDPATPTIPRAGYTFSGGLGDALSTVHVHPRQNAASINGRLISRTINRIASEPFQSGLRLQSKNASLLGTGAYAANKTTGTMPTDCSILASPTGTAAAIVATALQPGLNLVFTPDAATLTDGFSMRMTTLTLSPEPMRFQVWSRVKINSGASALSGVCALSTIIYSSGTSSHLSINNSLVADPGVQPCVYVDGDDLVLVSPEYTFTQGVTVTSCTCDVRFRYYSAAGVVPVDVTILACGILPVGRAPLAVSPGASPYSYTATLPGLLAITGGTVSAVELTRNGLTYVTLASATGLTVPMSRGDIVRTTYTVAPTAMTFIADNPA